jgi:hypothetical protein
MARLRYHAWRAQVCDMTAHASASGPPAANRPGEPRRWPHHPLIAAGVAVALVAVAAVAMLPLNLGYYEFWINYDPQTDDELYLRAKVTAFMVSTSGFFWGHLVALLLGARLAQRLGNVARAAATAVPAAVLLAVVNLVVAWQLSAASRRSLALAGEEARRAGLAVTPDLLDDRGFQVVMGAELAAFPIAAFAGVGLGALLGCRLRWPIAVTAIIAGVALPLGGIAAFANDEPAVLFALLALVPPAADVPAVVRTAVGDHGGMFTTTMLIGGAAWAALLVAAGGLAQQRRRRRTTGT